MDPLYALIHGSWYYGVILALQVICVIHVLKSRRELFWIWIIMILPVLGCGIYVWAHGGLSAMNHSRLIKIPMLEVLNSRTVARDFRLSPSLDNRIRFAEVLMAKGDVPGALQLFAAELDGPFKNNVNMLFSYAKVLYAAGRHEDSLAALVRAEAVPNNDRIRQRHLLHALNLELLGRNDEADARFKQAQGGFLGEEAKARYGLFLQKIGRTEDARKQFRRISESLELSNWSYRWEQRFWGRMAKRKLKETA